MWVGEGGVIKFSLPLKMIRKGRTISCFRGVDNFQNSFLNSKSCRARGAMGKENQASAFY